MKELQLKLKHQRKRIFTLRANLKKFNRCKKPFSVKILQVWKVCRKMKMQTQWVRNLLVLDLLLPSLISPKEWVADLELGSSEPNQEVKMMEATLESTLRLRLLVIQTTFLLPELPKQAEANLNVSNKDWALVMHTNETRLHCLKKKMALTQKSRDKEILKTWLV